MSARLDRLRAFLQDLSQIPLETPFTEETWRKRWEEADLTPEDAHQLDLLRQGHLQRAQRLLAQNDAEAAAEEWQEVLRIGPRQPQAEEELREKLKDRPEPSFVALRKLLASRKSPSRSRKKLPLPFLVGGLVGVALLLIIGLNTSRVFRPFNPGAVLGGSYRQSTSDLRLTLDTQGYPYQMQVQRSREAFFQETSVVEILTTVRFPKFPLQRWEAKIEVLSSDKTVLAERSVVLWDQGRNGILPPGQPVTIFEQFDAQAWTKPAAEVFIKTTLLIPSTAASPHPEPVTLQGDIPGINLSGVLTRDVWRPLFAKQENDLDLQITNTGLKALNHLLVTARWIGPQGTLWKSMTKTAVSPERSPLASGDSVMVHWTAEFPTEIYPMTDALPVVSFQIQGEAP